MEYTEVLPKLSIAFSAMGKSQSAGFIDYNVSFTIFTPIIKIKKMPTEKLNGRDDFEKLSPILLQFESKRNKLKWLFILSLVVLLILECLFTYYLAMVLGVATIGVVSAFFLLIAWNIFDYDFFYRLLDNYASKNMVPSIVQMLWTSYAKSPEDTVSYKKEAVLDLNIPYNTRFGFDHEPLKERRECISGKMNNKRITACNTIFYKGDKNADPSGTLTFIADFNTNFDGYICATKINTELGLTGYFSPFNSERRITLPNITADFNIDTSNPDAARQIMTQGLANRISDFIYTANLLFKVETVRVIIRDGRIEYYIPTLWKYELPLWHKFEESEFNNLCGDIQKILQLAEIVTAD